MILCQHFEPAQFTIRCALGDPGCREETMRQQHTLMRFDPATREEQPYPSHADQWREWHGKRTAWLYNPWTGTQRRAEDVGSDVTGLLIVPPDEPVYA
jgi:hypothetical protein